MVFSRFKKIAMFMPNKIFAINESVDKVIGITDKVGKVLTYEIKLIGASTHTI